MSGCAGLYAKPQIRCEAGRNKGNGNDKTDCWLYGEIGTIIKWEEIKDGFDKKEKEKISD